MAEENKGKVPVLPVIIPSYEPDDRLPELLSKLSASGLTPVVLVDDGSGPECGHYFDEAEKDPEITVLRHDRNMGKGKAQKTAFAYCLKAYPEMTGCITADSDGQHTPDSIHACLQALTEHPDELVLGVLDFYTSIGLRISFEKIPMISMLFSIGFQYWMLLNTFFHLIYRKKKELLLPVGMLLLYMLISSLVPLIVLRYFASVFLAIPLIVCITLQPEAAEH